MRIGRKNWAMKGMLYAQWESSVAVAFSNAAARSSAVR